MEIVLDKEERKAVLEQRLQKTIEEMDRQYNYAEAAAIMGNSSEEAQCRHKYYALFDEAEKIKKAIADEG